MKEKEFTKIISVKINVIPCRSKSAKFVSRQKKPGYTVQRKIYCLYNIPHFVLFYVSCSYNTTLVALTVIFAYRKQDVPLRKKQAS